ncbi:uncharacterized protein LOC143781547 [Ranitomeya variabilis]|uniref:uncharacterized protein LOC143781547 n=1 Tax=Ranitomeya variabilis TaxID=490064 RepID=UPI00405748B3
MDDYSIYMTDRILSLTLEIMFLLTGEDYTIVKKAFADHKMSGCGPSGSIGAVISKELVVMSPCRSVKQQASNERKGSSAHQPNHSTTANRRGSCSVSGRRRLLLYRRMGLH